MRSLKNFACYGMWMLSSTVLPVHGAGIVQADLVTQAVVPLATAQDEQLTKLDAELQRLNVADSRQLDVKRLLASYSESFHAFEQLVQQSGRESQYEKKVIFYRSHMLKLQAEEADANGNLGRSHASYNDRFDKFRNVAIGTTAYCEREFQRSLPKDKSLDCQNYGKRSFSVEDFEANGWDILYINTAPTVDSLGMQFTMYRVTFKKVR